LKKIIQITPAISEESSGPSYSVRRLTESLIEIGRDVELVSLEWPNTPKINILHTFPIYGNTRIGRSPELFDWLNKRASKTANTPIFHNHGMWQMNAVYPGTIANKYNIPYIVSPRGTFSQKAFNSGSIIKKCFWPLYQRPSFKNVSLFHATSYQEYLDIRNRGFKQPVSIIPNGIDIPPRFEKSEQSIRTLLFLGRIHPIKGLDLLLPAWKILQDKFPDWQLRIIGNDFGYHGTTGYKNKIIKLSNQLKIKRVIFSDALFGIEKWKAYSDSDIYILPTYSENFGVTVAEALSSGIPVIVTKGAPWENIEKIGAGYWTDIKIESLTNAMEKLMLMTPYEINKMGEKGRDWMINEYSWNYIANKMSNMYDWVVNDNENTNEFILKN
jgi:glycosyltransferase involved in cell wall biosynthesis